LLGDIRDIFKADRMASADLVEALVAIEGRPWAEMGRSHKPLTQNRLARMLKPLGITPENIHIGDKVPKGYVFRHFEEAFTRYLPQEGASEPLNRSKADEMGTSAPFQTATSEDDVAVRKREKPANDGHKSGRADEKGDDILDIPRFLDLRPRAADDAADYFPASLRRCAHCNRNGALGQVALPDRPGTIWLHRECEGAWLEATTHKQTSE
jgi:hypothetical protein